MHLGPDAEGNFAGLSPSPEKPSGFGGEPGPADPSYAEEAIKEAHTTPTAVLVTDLCLGGGLLAACGLIDDGCDVYGIGTGPLSDTIGKDEMARIYAMWARAKYPFG